MKRTLAIGDVHGCYDPLQRLLEKMHFNEREDTLWFTGDLINRGPESLKTLRFIISLPNVISVLGNHDLALLATAAGMPARAKDNFEDILQAPDRDTLLDWMRHRHFLHSDPDLGFILVHAGIYPSWDLPLAQSLAAQVETLIQDENTDFFQHMYGNTPENWSDELTSWDRYRFITNVLTRMRFVDKKGTLALKASGHPTHHPELIPWYDFPHRKMHDQRIIFGHWAALNAQTATPNVYPLDSGCVWGNMLTGFCLNTLERFQVPATSK